MLKNSYTSSFKKLPWAFLTALLAISLIESLNVFIYRNLYIAEPAYSDKADDRFEGVDTTVKNKISQLKSNDFDVLVFGDSFGNLGIFSQAIQKMTGLTCFNFSTNGRNSTFNSYCMFSNYLKSAAKKPKYVILAFLPHTLNISQPEPGYMYDFISGNFKFFVEEFGLFKSLKFLIPSLYDQPFFKSILHSPGRIFYIRTDKQRLYRIAKERCIKYNGSTEAPDESYRMRKKSEEGIIEYTFCASAFSKKYLTGLIDSARLNNIKVLYIVAPFSPRVSAILDARRQVKRYGEFIASLKTSFPGLIVIDPKNALDDMSLYIDAFHLNKKGASALDGLIAQKLKELEGLKNLQV